MLPEGGSVGAGDDDVQLRACATETSCDATRSKQELVLVGTLECISVSGVACRAARASGFVPITQVTRCFCSHHVLFDFRLLQIVQDFLARQKVRLCRGSLAGPGVVLGYGGDSRCIVLDILRVHVYLTDRTNALYREFSPCWLLTGRYTYPLFLSSSIKLCAKARISSFGAASTE